VRVDEPREQREVAEVDDLEPLGIPAFGPTLTMRPALTTMTGFSIVVPVFGSAMRAARITVVGGAGRLVGVWAPTEYADAGMTKANAATMRPMRTIGFTETSSGCTQGPSPEMTGTPRCTRNDGGR